MATRFVSGMIVHVGHLTFETQKRISFVDGEVTGVLRRAEGVSMQVTVTINPTDMESLVWLDIQLFRRFATCDTDRVRGSLVRHPHQDPLDIQQLMALNSQLDTLEVSVASERFLKDNGIHYAWQVLDQKGELMAKSRKKTNEILRVLHDDLGISETEPPDLEPWRPVLLS